MHNRAPCIAPRVSASKSTCGATFPPPKCGTSGASPRHKSAPSTTPQGGPIGLGCKPIRARVEQLRSILDSCSTASAAKSCSTHHFACSSATYNPGSGDTQASTCRQQPMHDRGQSPASPAPSPPAAACDMQTPREAGLHQWATHMMSCVMPWSQALSTLSPLL